MSFKVFYENREEELNAAAKAIMYLHYKTNLDLTSLDLNTILKLLPVEKIPHGTNPMRFAAIIKHLILNSE